MNSSDFLKKLGGAGHARSSLRLYGGDPWCLFFWISRRDSLLLYSLHTSWCNSQCQS